MEASILQPALRAAILCTARTAKSVKETGNLLRKIRLDIAVNEAFVDATIKAIIKGARTGKIGDGKIFVTELQRVVRIRTGEEGAEAIG